MAGRAQARLKAALRTTLTLTVLTPPVSRGQIGMILSELSMINVNRFPNATFDLLRTFLEKTIKAYAAKLGQEIKKSSNQSGFVYLSNALIWLEEYVKTTATPPSSRLCKKSVPGKSRATSLQRPIWTPSTATMRFLQLQVMSGSVGPR